MQTYAWMKGCLGAGRYDPDTRAGKTPINNKDFGRFDVETEVVVQLFVSTNEALKRRPRINLNGIST